MRRLDGRSGVWKASSVGRRQHERRADPEGRADRECLRCGEDRRRAETFSCTGKHYLPVVLGGSPVWRERRSRALPDSGDLGVSGWGPVSRLCSLHPAVPRDFYPVRDSSRHHLRSQVCGAPGHTPSGREVAVAEPLRRGTSRGPSALGTARSAVARRPYQRRGHARRFGLGLRGRPLARGRRQWVVGSPGVRRCSGRGRTRWGIRDTQDSTRRRRKEPPDGAFWRLH